MSDFDLNLLTHLAALVETRSVTEAAHRLAISQPAMSRSLARLRELLGDPILVRTRGGMLPTRRAEELVEPLRAWLSDARRIVAAPSVDPAGLARRFRLIASDYGLRSVVGPALAPIHAAAPAVAVDVLPPADDSHARLASGDADLLLTSIEPDRRLVHERMILVEDLLCVARRGHPLSTQAPDLADLMSWPHVGVRAEGRSPDPLSEALLAHGLQRNLVATLPYHAAAADLLASSDALMILPAGAAGEAVRDPRLGAFAAPAGLPRFRQWLVWHNRSHRDPAVQWLVQAIAGAHGAAPAAEPRLLRIAAE